MLPTKELLDCSKNTNEEKLVAELEQRVAQLRLQFNDAMTETAVSLTRIQQEFQVQPSHIGLAMLGWAILLVFPCYPPFGWVSSLNMRCLGSLLPEDAVTGREKFKL